MQLFGALLHSTASQYTAAVAAEPLTHHTRHYIRIVSSDCRLLTCQQRCLMMLGKESVTALYVGGWCSGGGAGAGVQGTSSCSGEWGGDTRLLPDTVPQLQSHAALMLHSHMTSSIGPGF